jgi:hypothetical protein
LIGYVEKVTEIDKQVIFAPIKVAVVVRIGNDVEVVAVFVVVVVAISVVAIVFFVERMWQLWI